MFDPSDQVVHCLHGAPQVDNVAELVKVTMTSIHPPEKQQQSQRFIAPPLEARTGRSRAATDKQVFFSIDAKSDHVQTLIYLVQASPQIPHTVLKTSLRQPGRTVLMAQVSQSRIAVG